MTRLHSIANEEASGFALSGLNNLNLVCAFSGRSQQNMSLFYGDTSESLANRRNFLSGLGIDYRDLVCAKQVHKSSIVCAKEKDKGKGALVYDNAINNTDAFLTNGRNLPLAVFTADCLSIFFYDYICGCIGLAHAGWRSSKENIAMKAAGLMQEKFGCKVENLNAGFGPAIRRCCYEVGSEFKAYFPGGIMRRKGRYYLDLIKINREQLLRSGIKSENIFDCGICTSCQNDDFFSYRREGKACGRMMSVAMLR